MTRNDTGMFCPSLVRVRGFNVHTDSAIRQPHRMHETVARAAKPERERKLQQPQQPMGI